MEKSNIIIGILIIIIIILIIQNYQKANQISALTQKLTEGMENDHNDNNSNKNNKLAINYPYPPSTWIPESKFSKGFLPQNQTKIVLYYTNWCGYSLKFLPVWKEWTKVTKTGIKTEAIDCEQNRAKCAEFDIKGFPEVILHIAKKDHTGINIKFTGDRTVESLENFVKQNLNMYA